MLTKHTIMVQGFPVKIYVNLHNTHAYVFPLFGRYYELSSDTDVMTFALTFLLANNTSNVITLAAYQSSGEDTAIIHLDKVA